MDSFIAKEAGEGKKDSIGSFSLSPEKAKAKLQQYQLEDSDGYLLKLIQAAVGAGAESIDIKAGRKELSLSFSCESSEIEDPLSILKAFEKLPSLEPSPLRDLVIGLNSAAADLENEVTWESPGGGLCVKTGHLVPFLDTHDGFRFTLKRPFALLNWLFRSAFASEISSVNSRAKLSCPIKIDGRWMGKPSGAAISASTGQLGFLQPTSVLEAFHPDPGSLNFRLWRESYQIDGEFYRLRDLDTDKTDLPALLRWGAQDGRVNTSIAFSVSPNYTDTSELRLYREGIHLETIEGLDLGHPGICVLADAASCRIDLSEFRIVQDQNFRELLQRIQNFVLKVTESVPFETLHRAFTSAGTNSLMKARYFHHFLREHKRGPAESVEALSEICLPDTQVARGAKITIKKEATLRRIHGHHLPKSEDIIAVYDGTLVGNAKLGFLLTPYRICWSNTLEAPNFMLHSDIGEDSAKLQDETVALAGAKLSSILEPELVPYVLDFLRSLPALSPADPPNFSFDHKERRILKSAVHHLGKPQKVYFAPGIPRDKLLKLCLAMEAKRLDPSDVLVLYDDTISGTCDNGLVLTRGRIVWRNLMESSEELSFDDLRSLKVGQNGSRLRLGKHSISICADGDGLISGFEALLKALRTDAETQNPLP